MIPSATNKQRTSWAQPGVIAVLGLIVGINLVADWFVFRQKTWLLFLLAEAIVIGGLIALTRYWRSRP
jgi:hypothetical protein